MPDRIVVVVAGALADHHNRFPSIDLVFPHPGPVGPAHLRSDAAHRKGSWSWPWGPRWRTCCGPTLGLWIHQIARPGSQPSCGPCPGLQENQEGPGRRRVEADRDRFVRRWRTKMFSRRTAAQLRDHRTWVLARAARDGSGPRCRAQACRSGNSRITTSVAQRRSQGFQPGPERPCLHD
jgi:hypothetical protein